MISVFCWNDAVSECYVGGTYSKTLHADKINCIACRTNKLQFCLLKLSDLNTSLLCTSESSRRSALSLVAPTY